LVNSSTLLSDTILFIRNDLRSNIIDPIASTRSSNEKFLMTSYPKRNTTYPIITVRGEIASSSKLGQQSEKHLMNFRMEIRIWARNEKEKNNLFDEVFTRMRINQYCLSSVESFNTTTNKGQTTADWDISLERLKMSSSTNHNTLYNTMSKSNAVIFDSTIKQILLSLTETKWNDNDVIQYFVNMDNNDDHWEEVQNNITYTLNNTGTNFRWMIVFKGNGGADTFVSKLSFSINPETSINEDLFDFGLNFANDLDNPGDEGIKSKICEYRYIFMA